MSTLHKMKVLTDSAQYDLCDYVNHQKSSQVNLPGIYHATGHNGCQIPLFKTLLTNKCKNDCKYCINQSKRTFTRLELKPEELAKAFMTYYNKGLVNGLFLSSGIADNEDSTMEKTIETCRCLRKDYGYDDYIHLKIPLKELWHLPTESVLILKPLPQAVWLNCHLQRIIKKIY